MSRRILLIDADTAFRDTLTKHIGRYRIVVMTEPDPDRALALATADPPDLVIIAVEEPDKAGFKTFQRTRKAVGKLPIVLVTKSMSKDSFTKHRNLKVHADEYMDKRGLTNDELVGKLDNLIGLGDLQEEDISIPVEDEIPMEIADGDVVLDEQLDEDPAAEFANPHDLATVGGNNQMIVDSMMSKELDGAFDALLDVEAPGLPIPEPVEPAKVVPHDAPDAGVPEPLPHKLADDDDAEREEERSEWDVDSVPAPINDGGLPSDAYEGAGEEPNVDDLPGVDDSPGGQTVAQESLGYDPSLDDHSIPPIVVDDEPIAVAVEEPLAAASDAPPEREGSLSSIPIVDDDLVSLDDDAIEEVEESPADDVPPVQAAPPPEPEAEPVHVSAPEPAPEPAVVSGEEGSVSRDIPERARRATGSQASIDLGLDKLAQDAESEQSGVYDRKSLRKIGELERQISQLKTELERARTAAEQAAKGGSRESQFLNLRESNLAKEKELKQLKATHEQQSKELAEAQEKLRQAQHAKTQLEAKNAEIEQKLAEDGGKVKELAASLRDATAQASLLEVDLAAKTKAAAAAEAQLAQVEKDLANERATGAASASEAERKLRAERDQVLVRHKGELAALRAEVEAQHELAAGRLREELEAAKAAAVEEAIEETRRVNAAEHAEAVGKLEHQHNAELVRIKSEHAGELSRIKNELTGEIEGLKGELAEAKASQVAALAAASDEREAAVAAAHRERDEAVATAKVERDEAVAVANAQRETAVAEANAQRETALAAAERATREAVAAAEAKAAHDIELLKAQHDADVEAREEEHQETLARDAQSHGQALSQLKQELDRTVASYETKLATARNEVDDLTAQAAREKTELSQAHELAIAALKSEQEQEVTLMADGARRAAEAHKQALAEQGAKYDGRLAHLQETTEREIAELKNQLQAATRAAEEAAIRHQAQLDELRRSHAEAVDDLEAKQERALDAANSEHVKAKSAADAEHRQAIASLKAEADRMLRQLEEERTKAIEELQAEREELRKGLSGARDSLKRSEGELASAVQTIADRNADLRAHAHAVAERDQRIAELRKELESLEQENANYQEQVLRAYQKIKSDEAMVARARKAMAIALTVLDDEGKPESSSS
jgi:hypothetical protein